MPLVFAQSHAKIPLALSAILSPHIYSLSLSSHAQPHSLSQLGLQLETLDSYLELGQAKQEERRDHHRDSIKYEET